MIQIQIDEAINGYVVYFNSDDDSKSYKVVTERKIDALQEVLNKIKELCIDEIKLIEEGGKLNEQGR